MPGQWLSPCISRIIYWLYVSITGPVHFLLLARKNVLQRISLDTPDLTDVVVPVSGVRHAVAIDFDPVDKFVYWSDDEKLEIKRSRMNGQGKVTVLTVCFLTVLMFNYSWCIFLIKILGAVSFFHYSPGPEEDHRIVPKVTRVVTFGISSLWGSLLSGGRYFRGVVTFGEQKPLNNWSWCELFFRNKRRPKFVKTIAVEKWDKR